MSVCGIYQYWVSGYVKYIEPMIDIANDHIPNPYTQMAKVVESQVLCFKLMTKKYWNCPQFKHLCDLNFVNYVLFYMKLLNYLFFSMFGSVLESCELTGVCLLLPWLIKWK